MIYRWTLAFTGKSYWQLLGTELRLRRRGGKVGYWHSQGYTNIDYNKKKEAERKRKGRNREEKFKKFREVDDYLSTVVCENLSHN